MLVFNLPEDAIDTYVISMVPVQLPGVGSALAHD